MSSTGYIAGVDEAGRGPLAGPVVAAAVILAGGDPIAGLADSKTLTARRRERLAVEIRTRALAWSVGYASVEEIDRLNILQASLLAMRRAVLGLALTPNRVLVDGNQAPSLPVPVITLVQGDRLRPDIGAASILAKTVRDRYMVRLDHRYPGYRFAAHMGYPTVAHRDAIARLGVTPAHRRSFAPVRAALVSRCAARAV